MATFSRQAYSDSTEVLDGNGYEACQFTNCILVYRGGALPRLEWCRFVDCQWRFEDAAERTGQFMAALHADPGLRPLADATLRRFRGAARPPAGWAASYPEGNRP